MVTQTRHEAMLLDLASILGAGAVSKNRCLWHRQHRVYGKCACGEAHSEMPELRTASVLRVSHLVRAYESLNRSAISSAL